MNLHDDQRRALALATAADGPRICVITGPPGCGKSTVVRSIVEHFERVEQKIVLAAPTGKAALRLTEATGRPACTIHRLLEPTFDRGIFRFARGPRNPIDAQVVVLDEVSMVDVHLMAKVMLALRYGARLILVGDIDQLPAVGPGAILSDLIASEKVPVARLTTIKRQDPGPLLRAIHAIKDGRAPAFENDPDGDLFFEERSDPAEIAAAVLELVLNRLPIKAAKLMPDVFGEGAACPSRAFNPLRDVQILVPTREKGALSCKALNEAFQARLFPVEEGQTRAKFYAGDKVIQTKNDYALGICNGDIGFIEDFATDSHGRKVINVAFDSYPGRTIEVPAAEHSLSLAYAITVHKAQGSEFPVVILPLHSSMPFMLLSRNWAYTAISRARSLCILLGERRALDGAIRRTSANRRVTCLASMLRVGP
jgi:exodeoxyribonuclease V alpha subunit